MQKMQETPVLSLGLEGGGNGSQPSILAWKINPVDKGAWQTTVHGVAKSQTWLINWACTHTIEHKPEKKRPEEAEKKTMRKAKRKEEKRGRMTNKKRKWENKNIREGNGNPLQYTFQRIPWNSGRLQSKESQRVRHNWATNTHANTEKMIIMGKIPWKIKRKHEKE